MQEPTSFRSISQKNDTIVYFFTWVKDGKCNCCIHVDHANKWPVLVWVPKAGPVFLTQQMDTIDCTWDAKNGYKLKASQIRWWDASGYKATKKIPLYLPK